MAVLRSQSCSSPGGTIPVLSASHHQCCQPLPSSACFTSSLSCLLWAAGVWNWTQFHMKVKNTKVKVLIAFLNSTLAMLPLTEPQTAISFLHCQQTQLTCIPFCHPRYLCAVAVKLAPKNVLTWGVLAILIMVIIGGLSLKVSFRQRSSKLRSLSWKYRESGVSKYSQVYSNLFTKQMLLYTI